MVMHNSRRELMMMYIHLSPGLINIHTLRLRRINMEFLACRRVYVYVSLLRWWSRSYVDELSNDSCLPCRIAVTHLELVLDIMPGPVKVHVYYATT